jgi:catecholate siderophore receptor
MKKKKGENQHDSGSDAEQKIEGGWPITYKWVAMGTLVAYTIFGSRMITVAGGQESQKGPGEKASPAPEQTAAAVPPRRFDVPPGPLQDVLPAFEAASGIHVLVTAERIGEIQSPGVTGVFSIEQALAHLLDGTRVSYRFTGPDLARLELTSLNQSVTVDADTLAQVASSKYTEPDLETPQSISVVPQHVMAEQNTTTLRDALRNVAGISLAAGEGGAQGDSLTIRGFTARNDIFLDAMRDFGSYYRDTFNQEEVEVLQGPSAVTFGRGTTGGVVNEVSKTPALAPFITSNVTFGSDLTRRVAVDINEPLPQLGSGAAFRFNLMGNDSKVSERDVAENRRYGFAPSLALGQDGPTRVVLSYFHQSENDNPDYGIPWLFNGPAPVNRKSYYGFQDGNFLLTNDDILTARVEHDAGHGITLHDSLRYAHEARNVQITEAQIPAGTTLATPLSTIQVVRNQINVDSVETMLDEQADATFRFDTGFVKHTLVAGLEAVRETSDPSRNTITGVPTTSLLSPNDSQPYSGTATPSTQVQVTATSYGADALDTISLGSKFDLIGGFRWDRFGTEYAQSVAPATAFSRVDRLPTWRGALVYKPKRNGSVYFDAGNSFNPSAETLSLSAANANTPPEKNITFEIGSKWDLASGRFSATGSIFRTDKTNAREPDPNNPLQNVLGGNQRVDGIQVTLTGHFTDRWELLSSYALLGSKVVSSMFYPLAVGAPLANVPRNTFNFWSTYHLAWKKLEVGGGGNFVDRRDASSTVPYDPTTGLLKQVPGYWVFNAMAEVPLSERIEFQLNLNNLTNRYYYDQIHPAHIVPGAGFTALAGLNFKF